MAVAVPVAGLREATRGSAAIPMIGAARNRHPAPAMVSAPTPTAVVAATATAVVAAATAAAAPTTLGIGPTRTQEGQSGRRRYGHHRSSGTLGSHRYYPSSVNANDHAHAV